MAPNKTDRLWKLLIFCIGLSITVMLFLWGYEWWISRKAHYTRYDEFGIDIPANYSVHGIDVSKYQRVIDWESVKAMKVCICIVGLFYALHTFVPSLQLEHMLILRRPCRTFFLN